jgi:hypothetical protein
MSSEQRFAMKLLPYFILSGLLLSITTTPACALDPPTVEGSLRYGQQRYELRYAQAIRSPDDPKRLWVLLTTAELSAKEAADASRTLRLAMSGTLRGVRLSIDAAAPNANQLQGALLLGNVESPGGEVVFVAAGRKYWDRLTLGDKRILGELRYSKDAWALEVYFNAPIFNAR